MIDSSADIPSILKLQYLLSSLKSEAALLFEHTTLTADNYATTWAALLKRYDNPRMLVRDYYRTLHHLPAMHEGSVDELAQLVDEFTRHVNGLRKLKEPVDNWDTPLTTLLFFKLDSSTILAWEKHSSASPKDKYSDLIDFLQDRIRILRSSQTLAKISESKQTPVVRSCNSVFRCNKCNARHHSMLHDDSPPQVTMNVGSSNEIVVLETVVLWLVDDHGIRHEARALLDSGSMCNIVSESLARKLLTRRTKINVALTGIGEGVQQAKGSIIATVQSKSAPFSSPLEFLIVNSPCAEIPTAPIDVAGWKFPDVPLADPAFNLPSRVDVIIGSDAYWEWHTGKKQLLVKGGPWSHESLDTLLQRFWENETNLEGPALSLEEDACEKHYAATTTRDHHGRYIVCLPRNPREDIVLDSSKEIADRRLMAVERRLKINPEMEMEYKRFMQEYEELGHMRKLTEPVDDSVPHCYIPHHAVVKESSTSTKVRVVFDASCKTSSGYSLNDTLLVGPIVQKDLLTGATDLNEAVEVRKQITAMLDSAGFALKKWASNVPESLLDVPCEDLAIQSMHEWKDGQAVSTLGLVWEPANDSFSFKVGLPQPAEVLTRSLILSYTASIVDPLESTDNIVTVQLLAAKSKVVSLANTHSIARLELCAARLATQLFQKVSRTLPASTMAFCWTDSMTVMYWLDSPPRRWKPFVANRVAQIQEETRIAEWRHVPGCDNPADDISRGLKPEELLNCERWWHGPRWLAYSHDAWPNHPPAVKENDGVIEERATASRIVTVSTRCEFRDKLFERYSSYYRLRRVVAYCLRFMECIKGANKSSRCPTFPVFPRLPKVRKGSYCQDAQEPPTQYGS
ncbi:uncharacterized protein LOC118507088 [Anopheles stephensi]|uniref:uncharacterized protein LOC118507088 n=1 Tax=Anopheles stephensi TaxID=30069 RepID=UPI00165874D0|nr:uncharacterized protein LOC118507088 [Anopheles stephensi]